MMQVQVRMFICDDGERFMGKGPAKLLRLTEQTGSLRRAAAQMGMSYSKAHGLIKRLEQVVPQQVLECHVGGASGGGAQLTEYGRCLLQAYEEMNSKINAGAEQAFSEFCAAMGLDNSDAAST
ncbi:LysR family transcriptional regulator [bacterium]|nr:LysR family transcriptional regulator [bacterium]